jgi:hypothetical protein
MYADDPTLGGTGRYVRRNNDGGGRIAFAATTPTRVAAVAAAVPAVTAVTAVTAAGRIMGAAYWHPTSG